MNAKNQPTLLLFLFVQKPTNKNDSKVTVLPTDVDVALHFFVEYKVGGFAQIVVQKIIASQVVEKNILRKFSLIKIKIVREQKLSHVKILKKLSVMEIYLSLPQLSIGRICLISNLHDLARLLIER